MANEVDHYPLRPPGKGLGSFMGDRQMFTMKGKRTDGDANRSLARLILEIRELFTDSSLKNVEEAIAASHRLGSVPVNGHRYQAYTRSNGGATIAFYCHPVGEGYQTVLLGAETDPPLDGLQTWWRSTIRGRLADLLR